MTVRVTPEEAYVCTHQNQRNVLRNPSSEEAPFSEEPTPGCVILNFRSHVIDIPSILALTIRDQIRILPQQFIQLQPLNINA